MRMTSIAVLAVLLVTRTVWAATEGAVRLSANVEARTLNGTPLLFQGVDGRVHLWLERGNGENVPDVLPTRWQEAVEWVFTPVNGGASITAHDVRIIGSFHTGKSLSPDEALQLRPGGPVDVTYVIRPPTSGEYYLQARLSIFGRTYPSTTARVSVRRGDETREIRAIMLRTKAERIRETPPACEAPPCIQERWQEYRAAMMQLIELEPNDAGLWEALGDVSLGKQSPEETRQYYDRARQTAEASLTQRYGSMKELPVDVRQFWEKYQRELTLYAREVYPYVLQHPSANVIVSAQRNQKVFVAFTRDGKRREFRNAEPPLQERRLR